MLDNPEYLADVFAALDTENRLRAFEGLVMGKSPVDIAEELGVDRSTIQPYIDDFRELDWIMNSGHDYSVTANGNAVWDVVSALDQSHSDYEELQGFLRENPGVVPEEVLGELRGDHKD